MLVLPQIIITRSRNETLRKFCTKVAKKTGTKSKETKVYGQPSFYTHPHLVNKGEVTPLIKKSEYQNRRIKLVDAIGKYVEKLNRTCKNNIIIIPAAQKQYMSDKIPYVFRQNTEFLYLTGCQEPDCCIVLTCDGAPEDHCATLFTRDKDEHAELWDGPRTHPENAPHFFGVSQSLPISDLPNFLQSYKKSHRSLNLWYDFPTTVHQNIHQIVSQFMKECCDKHWESPKPFIQKQRLYKSPAEISLMQKACDITSQAFLETIAASKPDIGEDQLFATVDYECRMRGAQFLAYPPVIAGGNRANIIHYINNNQLVRDNELVLMDAGCEYHGYASDVTRTWPVNGKFTPQQQEIYEIVLDVQEELIQLCAKMPTLDSLFETMCYLLGKRLQQIGIIGKQPSDAYLMKAAYQLCPHHVSHYLGMDIHDTPIIPRNIRLEPGMVITVEPGIYISEKNTVIPKEYHGIGVRIEDDVLITSEGPVVLSKNCPKSVAEIQCTVGTSC